jgi:hypothetical protein
MPIDAKDLADLGKLPLDDFVAAMDARHRAALAAAEWWPALKAARPSWDDSGVGMSFDSAVLRRRFPTHFVMGLLSPFYSEGIAAPDRRRCTWAVSFSPFAENARGHGQGGAVAAIFDLATASLGSQLRGGVGGTPTKSLAVRYRRPLVPMPGVFRLDVEVVEEAEPAAAGAAAGAGAAAAAAAAGAGAGGGVGLGLSREIHLRATLSDGSGTTVYDSAEATLVDLSVKRPAGGGGGGGGGGNKQSRL